MTDATYLALLLSDGRWHSHAEIIRRSIRERGYGLTVHSRAAQLRGRGYEIECRLRKEGRSRSSEYRMVATPFSSERPLDDRNVHSGAITLLSAAPSPVASLSSSGTSQADWLPHADGNSSGVCVPLALFNLGGAA